MKENKSYASAVGFNQRALDGRPASFVTSTHIQEAEAKKLRPAAMV